MVALEKTSPCMAMSSLCLEGLRKPDNIGM